MASRLKLHDELLTFLPNVYYQPPESLIMQYPCIVYTKYADLATHADNKFYVGTQGYTIILIEHDPDSTIANQMLRHFSMCNINQYYTLNGLNHTNITLYY